MGKSMNKLNLRNMEFIEIGSNDLVLNAAAMKPVNRYLMKRNKRLSNRYLSLSISNLKLESEINIFKNSVLLILTSNRIYL